MNGTDLTKRLPFAFSTFKWNQGFAAPQKNSRTTTVKLKSANAATLSTVSSLLKKDKQLTLQICSGPTLFTSFHVLLLQPRPCKAVNALAVNREVEVNALSLRLFQTLPDVI